MQSTDRIKKAKRYSSFLRIFVFFIFLFLLFKIIIFSAHAETITLNTGQSFTFQNTFKVYLTTDEKVVFLNSTKNLLYEIPKNECKNIENYQVCVLSIDLESQLIKFNYSLQKTEVNVGYEIQDYGIVKEMIINFTTDETVNVDAKIQVLNAKLLKYESDMNIVEKDNALFLNETIENQKSLEITFTSTEDAIVIVRYTYFDGSKFETRFLTEEISFEMPYVSYNDYIIINSTETKKIEINFTNTFNQVLYVVGNFTLTGNFEINSTLAEERFDFEKDTLKDYSFGLIISPNSTKTLSINLIPETIDSGRLEINGNYYIYTPKEDFTDDRFVASENINKNIPNGKIYRVPFNIKIGINKNVSKNESDLEYDYKIIINLEDDQEINSSSRTLNVYNNYYYHARVYFDAEEKNNYTLEMITNFLVDFDLEYNCQRRLVHDFTSLTPLVFENNNGIFRYVYKLNDVDFKKIDDFFIYTNEKNKILNFTIYVNDIKYETIEVNVSFTELEYDIRSYVENKSLCLNITNDKSDIEVDMNFENAKFNDGYVKVMHNESKVYCNKVDDVFEKEIFKEFTKELCSELLIYQVLPDDLQKCMQKTPLVKTKICKNITSEIEEWNVSATAYYTKENDELIINIISKTDIKNLVVYLLPNTYYQSPKTLLGTIDQLNGGKVLELKVNEFRFVNKTEKINLLVLYDYPDLRRRYSLISVDIINKENIPVIENTINSTDDIESVSVDYNNNSLILQDNKCNVSFYDLFNINNTPINLDFDGINLVLTNPRYEKLPTEYLIGKVTDSLKLYNESCIKQIIDAFNNSDLYYQEIDEMDNFDSIIDKLKLDLHSSCEPIVYSKKEYYEVFKLYTEVFLFIRCGDIKGFKKFTIESPEFIEEFENELNRFSSTTPIGLINNITPYINTINKINQKNKNRVDSEKIESDENPKENNETKTDMINETNKNTTTTTSNSQNDTENAGIGISAEDLMKKYYSNKETTKDEKTKQSSSLNLKSGIKNFLTFGIIIAIIFLLFEIYNTIVNITQKNTKKSVKEKKSSRNIEIPHLTNDED